MFTGTYESTNYILLKMCLIVFEDIDNYKKQ